MRYTRPNFYKILKEVVYKILGLTFFCTFFCQKHGKNSAAVQKNGILIKTSITVFTDVKRQELFLQFK